MIIVLIIILLLLISYCKNKDLKESYGYHRRYKRHHNIYHNNPYRHYLKHRYYTGTYPQYYYPIYKTYSELNEENCRKYYPCEEKI